ncbi:MAG: hypothetical protein CME68_05970 [Halobacteriovoraceae bacterium]|nr:hypothetical protein [Halobacteriovoraceae bacterium]
MFRSIKMSVDQCYLFLVAALGTKITYTLVNGEIENLIQFFYYPSLFFVLQLLLFWGLLFGRKTLKIGVFGLGCHLFSVIYKTYPLTINHFFLEFIILILIFLAPLKKESLFDDRRDLKTTILYLQILYISVWFYSGIQKFFWGYYLNGEMFALSYLNSKESTDPLVQIQHFLIEGLTNFKSIFIPACCTNKELVFPGIVKSIFIVQGWLVGIFEMVFPILLFFKRTRVLGFFLVLFLQLTIVISSGEWDFMISSLIILVSLFYLYDKFDFKYVLPSKGFKSYFSFGIMICLLVWPTIHMGLSSQGYFSSWRFFGWGMYATPHPQDGVTTNIIFHPKKPLPILNQYSKNDNLKGIRFFVFDGKRLQKVNGDHYLLKKMIKFANIYFLHIPNEKHKSKLVEVALNFLKLERDEFKGADLIKTRQRFNLLENKLYTVENNYKVKF